MEPKIDEKFISVPTLAECAQAVADIGVVPRYTGLLASNACELDNRTVEFMRAHPEERLKLDYVVSGKKHGNFVYRHTNGQLYRVCFVGGERWEAEEVPLPEAEEAPRTLEEEFAEAVANIGVIPRYQGIVSQPDTDTWDRAVAHMKAHPEEKIYHYYMGHRMYRHTDGLLYDVFSVPRENRSEAHRVFDDDDEEEETASTPEKAPTFASAPGAPVKEQHSGETSSVSSTRKKLDFEGLITATVSSTSGGAFAGMPFLDVLGSPLPMPAVERTVVRLGKRKREPTIEDCLAAIAALESDLAEDPIHNGGLTMSARTDVVIGALDSLDANPDKMIEWLCSSYNGETTVYAFRTTEGRYYKLSHIRTTNGDTLRADPLEDERVVMPPTAPRLRRTDTPDDVKME
jgi:hypothetical protein